MAKEEEEDATLVASSALFTSSAVCLIGRLLAAVGSGACRTGGRAGAFPTRTGGEPGGGRRAAGEADHARTSLVRLTRAASADGKGRRGAEAGVPMVATAADVEAGGPAMRGLSKGAFLLVADTNAEVLAPT
jgi:hypothetical protein